MNRHSTESPKVGIIILNWNNYPDTSKCIDSLQDISYENHRIFVVDNNSTDGSRSKLKREYPDCEFIFKNKNTGFSSGCNEGIKKALASGCEYILLLNNDTVVSENFLTPLVDTIERNDKVGIVGGVIYYHDSEQIWYAGGSLSKYKVKSPHNTLIKSNEAYHTGFVTGALMLMSDDFLDEVGLLNETYFFGMDDKDICWRAKRNGWDLMVNPDSKIEHKVGATSGADSPFQAYHTTWNRFHFAHENLAFENSVVFYLYFLLTRVYWLITGRFDMMKATIHGIIDFCRGKSPYRQYL